MKLSNKTIILASCFLFLFCATNKFAHAVEIEAGDWLFGVNGFVGSEFTQMGKMPMLMTSGEGHMDMGGDHGSSIMYMDKRSFFSFHLDQLFTAERENIKVVTHLEAHDGHNVGTETEEHDGDLGIGVEEAYGVYLVNDALELSFGSMLAPFGIHNNQRYIAPLFSSVALPQMYEMPDNYASGDTAVSQSMVSFDASVMMSGHLGGDGLETEYYLYLANGATKGDIGYGGRLRVTLRENYKIGASFYSVDNDESTGVGKKTLTGVDIEINYKDMLKLEGEYARDDFEGRKDRLSYYVRLMGYIGAWSPYLAYDYAQDKGNMIYKNGQGRYSVGFGYNFSNYVIFKGEYHLHRYDNADMRSMSGGKSGSDDVSMFKTVMVFVF